MSVSQKTNIAPENGWLEDRSFLLGAVRPIFRGKLAVSFREGMSPKLGTHPPPPPPILQMVDVSREMVDVNREAMLFFRAGWA